MINMKNETERRQSFCWIGLVVLGLLLIAVSAVRSTNGNSHQSSDRRTAGQKRFEMERDGAVAEVDILVKDRFGMPISGASVHLFFNQPKSRPEKHGLFDGITDGNGRYFARAKTTYACHWQVSKEGFYPARGILPFSNHFTIEQAKEGRWTASPLALEVILDERSGAKLLHGFIGIRDLSFPTNTWVGFDFEANDCVAPYGLGKHSHLLFQSTGSEEIRHVFQLGGIWTNRLVIAAPGGGMKLLSEKEDTDMPFCHEAPDSFSSEELEFTYTRGRDRIVEDTRPGKKEYIVFQSTIPPKNSTEPHYGIIRNLEFWPGGLRMEYFFNPIPGDRRTDADIRSGRDLTR